MKNFIQVFFIAVFFASCDPSATMEASIENLTTQDLIIEFIANDQTLNKTLVIPKNDTQLFQEGFDIGTDYLEPYLLEYDSVVVKNTAQQIVKVYKPTSDGKNIFNIKDHWMVREPSKSFFIYKFEMYAIDLE